MATENKSKKLDKNKKKLLSPRNVKLQFSNFKCRHINLQLNSSFMFTNYKQNRSLLTRHVYKF